METYINDTKTTYQKSERFSKFSILMHILTKCNVITYHKFTIHFCDISLIAFPEEFIRPETITSCNINEKSTLRQFPYDASILLNGSTKSFEPNLNSSLNQCEKYCGKKNECWGCIKHCNDFCQWIAIAECENQGVVTDLDHLDKLQKPGV